MIIKEHYCNSNLTFAEVLYQEEENTQMSDIVFDECPIMVKEYRVERLNE